MSASNPMHHTTSGQTKRNVLKEEREWRDLQNAKIAFAKRLQEDAEAEEAITKYVPRCEPGGYYDDIYEDAPDWDNPYPYGWEEDDDSTLPF